MTIQLPGLSVLLFIAFLVLKLCKVIAWSWLWVTAPLWLSAALGVLILTFILGITVLVAASKS